MDGYDYHRRFVAETGSTIDQRAYLRALAAEYADVIAHEPINRRPRATVKQCGKWRDETARNLRRFYRDALHGEISHLQIVLDAPETTRQHQAAALFTWITYHRLGALIMHAAAAVDRAKGGE